MNDKELYADKMAEDVKKLSTKTLLDIIDICLNELHRRNDEENDNEEKSMD